MVKGKIVHGSTVQASNTFSFTTYGVAGTESSKIDLDTAIAGFSLVTAVTAITSSVMPRLYQE
jgi:hypothetical protein